MLKYNQVLYKFWIFRFIYFYNSASYLSSFKSFKSFLQVTLFSDLICHGVVVTNDGRRMMTHLQILACFNSAFKHFGTDLAPYDNILK